MTVIINMTDVMNVMVVIKIMELTDITFVCKIQKYFWY